MQLHNLLSIAALVLSALTLASPVAEPQTVAPVCKPCNYFPQYPVINCFRDSCTPECNLVADAYDRKRCLACCPCYQGCRSCVKILGLSTGAAA